MVRLPPSLQVTREIDAVMIGACCRRARTLPSASCNGKACDAFVDEGAAMCKELVRQEGDIVPRGATCADLAA